MSDLAQTIMMNTFGSVGFIANSMVIAVLVKFTRFSEKPSMQFILMQSLIDALASLSIIFNNRNFGYNLNIVRFDYDENVLGLALCFLWHDNMVMASLFVVSTFNLVLLTMERYFKILHPFLYMKHFRKWKLRFALVLPWFIGFMHRIVTYLPHLSITDKKCTFHKYHPAREITKAVWNLLVTFIIPICIMAFCYGRIFRTLQKTSKLFGGSRESGHVSRSGTSTSTSPLSPDDAEISDEADTSKVKVQMVDQSSLAVLGEVNDAPPCRNSVHNDSAPSSKNDSTKGLGNDGSAGLKPQYDLEMVEVSTKVDGITKASIQGHQYKISRSEKKVLKTLIIVTLCFFLSWVGYQIIFFIYAVFHALTIFNMFDDFVISLAFLNSVINPFIYVITLKEYSHKLLNKFRK